MQRPPYPRRARARNILLAAVAGLAVTLAFAAAASALSIKVSGAHLVDGGGRYVRLIGVDRGDLACTTFSQAFYGSLASDPAAMAAWHVNAVRIALNEDCWLGINGVADTAYRSQIESFVAALNAKGIYTVLDLHQTAPGTILSSGIGVLADASHATAFWQSVASTFKDNHAVLFDAINEPHPFAYNDTCTDQWAAWLSGCTFTRVHTASGNVSGSWPGVGMQQLVNAIRGTGATQPIILECRSWGALCDQFLTHLPYDPDHQLVGSWHAYDSCSSTCYSEVAAIAAKVPFVWGEFGTYDCSTAFLGQLMNWSDQRRLGYIAWRWAPYGCGDPSLLSSYNGTPKAGYGQTIQNHFKAVSFAG